MGTIINKIRMDNKAKPLPESPSLVCSTYGQRESLVDGKRCRAMFNEFFVSDVEDVDVDDI